MLADVFDTTPTQPPPVLAGTEDLAYGKAAMMNSQWNVPYHLASRATDGLLPDGEASKQFSEVMCAHSGDPAINDPWW